MAVCAVCSSADKTNIEEYGLAALQEKRDPDTGRMMSWRRASELAGVYPQSLKNHMEKHFTQRVEDEAEDELKRLIKKYEVELLAQAEVAPPEVKPLYLVAVRNLRGLADTNASQQNLITALKTIQDITGMKAQQSIMLGFARAKFRELSAVDEVALDVPAIESEAGVLIAEVVE